MLWAEKLLVRRDIPLCVSLLNLSQHCTQLSSPLTVSLRQTDTFLGTNCASAMHSNMNAVDQTTRDVRRDIPVSVSLLSLSQRCTQLSCPFIVSL